MKHRHVFSVEAVATANSAVAIARALGIEDANISLLAREDIELEQLSDNHADSGNDTIPAAARGALQGGSIGLLAGLVAIASPPTGITIAGAGLLAALGSAVGGWTAALIGSAVPNEVRRRFESEIEHGRILVVLDAEKDSFRQVETALIAVGAKPLPFDRLSLIS